MSPILTIVVTASGLGLIATLVFLELRGRYGRRLLATAVLITLVLAVFRFVAPPPIEAKGPEEETIAVVLCYFAMLLGMAAEYGYRAGERGRGQFNFDPMQLLMPVFASPIVFIPLLTIATEMPAWGGAFTRPKLMVYLIAFQNGFFWKSFFEQRRRGALEAAAGLSREIPKPPAAARSRTAAAK
jgi:hypothetical protein